MAPAKKRKGGADNASLLSPSTYDRDAPDYTSIPTAKDVNASTASLMLTVPDDEGSDDDDDDDDDLRASDDDRDVLLEEEEREKLLSRSGLFGAIGRRREEVVIGKRRVKGRRRRPGSALGEDNNRSKESIGVPYSDEDSGTDNDDDDDGGDDDDDGDDDYEEVEQIRRRFTEKGKVKGTDDKKPRGPSCRRLLVITVSLLSFLLLLVFSSLRLSFRDSTTTTADGGPNDAFHTTTSSNGSHIFYPTTIFISLDGLRADYLDRGITPGIQSLVESGVTTPYMTPSFPSVTFPNHWTLVTGLHPESHGIVGNHFYDPELKRYYSYRNTSLATLPFWYGGSPIWSVAEENNVRSAIHMWPGSEMYLFHPDAFSPSSLEGFRNKNKNKNKKSKRMRPSYVDAFNSSELLTNKVSRIFGWLDLPLDKRPQLILSYVPNVDQVGHKFGPNTTEEDAEIKKVDAMVSLLLSGLDSRNLTDLINVVIVSDHGMASTSNDRLIYLEDILGRDFKSNFHDTEGFPNCGLRPADHAAATTTTNITALYLSLVETQQAWTSPGLDPKQGVDPIAPWKVHLRDSGMPERFHFSKNPRIAPLWIFPETGWAIVDEDEYPRGDKFPADGYHPRGIHGYDNAHPLMRAMFVARGPAFRQAGLHGDGRAWAGALLDGHSGGESLSEPVDKRGLPIVGKVVQPFANTELYQIIGETIFGSHQVESGLLGPHNGTFREGIRGLRVIEAGPKESAAAATTATTTTRSASASASAPAATPEQSSSHPIKVDEPPNPNNKQHQGQGQGQGDPAAGAPHQSWWDFLKWKAQRLKESMENWWGKAWLGEDAGAGAEDGQAKQQGKGPKVKGRG